MNYVKVTANALYDTSVAQQTIFSGARSSISGLVPVFQGRVEFVCAQVIDSLAPNVFVLGPKLL